jgi:formate dehydrogenase subunit gamma
MQESIVAVIERTKDLDGPLLPILRGIQEALGHVPSEAVPTIATALNLSTAEVHGVISFYPDFRAEPVGRQIVQVCCAEACQARGCRALEAHATQSLRVDYDATRSDGAVSLKRVYCLGNCACGPSVRIGGEVYGRVDPARFDELIRATVAGGSS